MSDFSKVYSVEDLMNSGTVTILSLPMEESVMFPVAQAIDLMKNGQNVLYFTFKHDSIKLNGFFKMALEAMDEEEVKKITGNLAVIDAHQIPAGTSWEQFFKDEITDMKKSYEINFVFFDVMEFIENQQSELCTTLDNISFMDRFTKIIVKTSEAPIITAIQSQSKEEIPEDIDLPTLQEMYKESQELVEKSSIVLGIQREKENFWKKVINFLLFWRKSNNFTLKVLKNKNGKRKSYRMNLDMETSKTEIL